MKKPLLQIALLLVPAFAVSAQGVVNFTTRFSGLAVAHVYAESQDVSQSGNSPTELPAGTTIYTGPRLTGSGFSASLWAANGPGQPESALVLVPGSLTSFRTGPTLGGTPAPANFGYLRVPNVPIYGTGTFQIRAWDNEGGIYTSWETARYRGKSDLFDVANLYDGYSLSGWPTELANVRSFSFYDPLFAPEPSPFALISLGALGFWLARRGQVRR